MAEGQDSRKQRAANYRAQAKQALEMSAKAATPDSRAAFVALADGWLKLAEETETSRWLRQA
jgi:hypothetical protein